MESFGTDEFARKKLIAARMFSVRTPRARGAEVDGVASAAPSAETADDRITRMVTTHSKMLLRIAAARLDSMADAEDAVQDVLCRVVENGIVFCDAEHERAWLIRATLNRASDLRKRAARRNVPLDEALAVAAESPADAPDAVTGSDGDVLACMRKLPEKYAVPLHLHYYEGYTIQEIGQLLDVPSSTVGTRLARGRKRLERMLGEEQR